MYVHHHVYMDVGAPPNIAKQSCQKAAIFTTVHAVHVHVYIRNMHMTVHMRGNAGYKVIIRTRRDF